MFCKLQVEQSASRQWLLGVVVVVVVLLREVESLAGIVTDRRNVTLAGSPYIVDDDLVIEASGSVYVEAGVVFRFWPGRGVIVRGSLVAKGAHDARIRMESYEEVPPVADPGIRLVDGATPLTGRLQIKHKDHWRSVCTNSRNWTIADYETACRQMGYTGGRFVSWMDRANSSSSRPLLLENPRCNQSSTSLVQCDWNSRRIGPGVCDYQPDLGMECSPFFWEASGVAGKRWRGIRFEDARHKKDLIQKDTLYVKVSESVLHYVDLVNAGVGADGGVHSSLESVGVVPRMEKLVVEGSAYNGINLTRPDSIVNLRGVTLINNRGYGLYINTSSGSVLVESSNISNNTHSGVKYIFHDLVPDKVGESVVETHDLCTSASTMTPVYPLPILAESYRESITDARCEKRFTAAAGQVLTLHFIYTSCDEESDAQLQVHDGPDSRSPLIGTIRARNSTRPQSMTTTRNSIWILYKSKAPSRSLIRMQLTSGYSKAYDLNITNSVISTNGAAGILAENMRSLLHLQGSTVRENTQAGLQIADGSADVNITSSYIGLNYGDGVNMTYSGGRINISYSAIEANSGHGVVLWFNETSLKPAIHPEAILAYNTFSWNKWTSVMVGNFCAGISSVNISGNIFNESHWDAVEIVSCRKPEADHMIRNVLVTNNKFQYNDRIALVMEPAVSIRAVVEHNLFRHHKRGCLRIANGADAVDLEQLSADVLVQNNRFEFNSGSFVAHLALSEYADAQRMLFSRNWIKRNKIRQPFPKLNPRTRIAAVVVIGSSNVNVTRNMIDNPDSDYEIGSQLEDHSRRISCVRNWLGAKSEKEIFYRIFDRKDRFNLAQVSFKPFLLHDTNMDTDAESSQQDFVAKFVIPGSREIGGEVSGQEELIEQGSYRVTRDIIIHPTGRLVVAFGVRLEFEHTIGMFVGGELIADGSGSSADGSIVFTLAPEHPPPAAAAAAADDNNNDDSGRLPAALDDDESVNVRLVGGGSETEGRLQIRMPGGSGASGSGGWGTVCNYGWTMQSAAVACQQMGFVLNPHDWFIDSRSLPPAPAEAPPVRTANVRCTQLDNDIRDCPQDSVQDMVNECGHDQDVGLRCQPVSWAGIRFGMTARKSVLRYATVQKAGLFDYATHSFQPAIRIDLHHHVLDRLQLVRNDYDGLGIMYSDLYYPERIPNLKNSHFSDNRRHGISVRSLGLHMSDCRIEGNDASAVDYDPLISRAELREMVGWLSTLKPESLIMVPGALQAEQTVVLSTDLARFLITGRGRWSVESVIVVETDRRNVIGMQVLSPISALSTESILIEDFGDLSGQVWDVRTNLSSFPTVSSSYKVTIRFRTGADGRGGGVLLLSAFRRSDLQIQRSRLLSGPIPTLTISSTTMERNGRGISARHYNHFLDDDGNHLLRKSNETIQVIGCEIANSRQEAILVHTPWRNVGRHPLAEIKYMINYTTMVDNERAIVQTGRDLRHSNNLFHWILQNNTIRANRNGGLEIRLPYVWQYNENLTHSVYVSSCALVANRNFQVLIDGHFARVNITDNHLQDNDCQPGLLSLRGMEKEMYILRNHISRNSGRFLVEFQMDSQSEILGQVSAYLSYNKIRDNRHKPRLLHAERHLVAAVSISLKGVQKVNVTNNLLDNPAMDYELLAGIQTAHLDNYVNVQANYWGTTDVLRIRERIFDFDDWNSYAVAHFSPYFLEDSLDAGQSMLSVAAPVMSADHELGGRLYDDLVLVPRPTPYQVTTDLTVMPGVILTILPGVELEFLPSVGILVLGILHAEGHWQAPIQMRLSSQQGQGAEHVVQRRQAPPPRREEPTVRLSVPGGAAPGSNFGYVDLFNETTNQWVPVCDARFTEQNARVVCRQLGIETFTEFHSFGRRWQLEHNSLARIRSWPEPFACDGSESRLEDCDVRMSGQSDKHVYSCPWDGDFVFIHCGDPSAGRASDYWGGIRFSVAAFEDNDYNGRHHGIAPVLNEQPQSKLEYVNISSAGILHGEKSPAVLAILKSPSVQQVNVSNCASDGISFISPSANLPLLDNRLENNLGVGMSVLMLNGETRDADLSAFSPLLLAAIPYNTFGILNACDPGKQVSVEERILVYYRYDNRPADCVKIFTSNYGVKTFGFRLLQLNLVNSAGQPSWDPDSLTLYDGDIYNITSSSLLAEINASTTGPTLENRLYRTKKPSLSLKVHSSGASGLHGFVAEVITLPIAAIGFGRNIRHNISYSAFVNNQMGAVRYSSAGEINPMLTMEWNQILSNGVQLYANFSTSAAAVAMDVQNMETLVLRNNLIRYNQGGLRIQADSNGVPTSLKAVVHNNVFADNNNSEVLYLQGRRSSPYQEVTLYRNYITRSSVPYKNVVVLNQIVANFSHNFLFNNFGYHIMDVYGFGRVRLPIYQTFYRNSFHKNFAGDRDNRATVIAGSSGQQYIDNVFVNPLNDYEMITLNWTGLEMQRTPIEASNNWWGYNGTSAVVGRIRDYRDFAELLQVRFLPFHLDNRTVLSGKCDPGWTLVGDTCYMYIGVPMKFHDAKDFCKKDNASLAYLMSNYYGVMEFLQSQQMGYDYYARVWVQHLDMIGQCVVFVNRRVERSPCDLLLPFMCEADPLVILDPLGWTDDGLTVALLGASAAAFLLVILCAAFWASKSRHRASQRFERRNSIRASIRSSRSINSLASSSVFLDSAMARRNKPFMPSSSSKANPKFVGSVDSIQKSQLNSSAEDNRSFDIYEAADPAPRFSYSQLTSHQQSAAVTAKVLPSQPVMHPSYDLTFENHGYRDNNSSYLSQNPSRAPSEYWDTSSLEQNSANMINVSVHQNGVVSYQPQPSRSSEPDYSRLRSRSDGANDNYSTASVVTDSTLAMKRELHDMDAASAVTLPHLPSGHHHSSAVNGPPSCARSQQLLETNFDLVEVPRHAITTPYLASSDGKLFLGEHSKSTPLETDM